MEMDKIKTLYPEGMRLTVKVEEVERYGAFVTLQENIRGYIPVKELSWTGSVLDAREALKPGNEVDVIVLNVDTNTGDVHLSVKRAQQDPWPNFCNTHKVGDIIRAKVIRVLGKAAFVEIDTSVNGVIPLSLIWINAEKMEQALLVGDEVCAKIVEFEEDQVLLSIATLYLEDEQLDDKSESGWELGKTLQETFDLLNYKHGKETEFNIGLTEEAKEYIKRILLIDPEEQIARTTLEMLERLGFSVQYAPEGKEALAKIKSEKFDLVITSVGMPQMDGFSLANELMKQEPSPIIIFQSAEKDIKLHTSELEKMGLFSQILTKPWTPREFASVINNILKNASGQESQPQIKAENLSFIDKIATPSVEGRASEQSIESILQKLKQETVATFAAVFQMHLNTLETQILVNCGLEKKLNENERKLLRFSPVKDVIYGGEELKSNSVSGKRFEHLRPLGKFKSVIGIRLDFSSDWGYSIFLFAEKEGHFTDSHMVKAKIATQLLGTAIERKNLEDIYKHQHKFLLSGRISASLVHELKNEQQAIFNYIDILKADSVDLNAGKIKADEKFLARFQRVTNGLLAEQEKIQSIQNLFLNLVKEKDEEQVQLSEHLCKLIPVFKAVAKKSKIEIESPEKIVPMCFINTGRFDQIITNLLMNAFEQIPLVRQQSGKVWLEVDFIEDDELPLKVEIKDNGPGIHAVHKDRIFDIFFTTKKSGTGLGLFISKALVNSMGGRISVKETIRFEGTTFLIELPFKDRE